MILHEIVVKREPTAIPQEYAVGWIFICGNNVNKETAVMTNTSLWMCVEEVLKLVKKHSEKYRSPKQVTITLQRLSGWASVTGGVIFVGGEVLRQIGLQWAYLSLAIFGLVIFVAGAVAGLVESIRTTRRPFVDLVDRVLEALGRESELIAVLECFEREVLEIARKRLQLESTKVASRLGLIGGDGLKASLVGIAMLAAAMISQYEPVIRGWTTKSLAFFGVVLLLGLSIGGLLARYGASQADYYSEIIGIALQRKAYKSKKSPKLSASRHTDAAESPSA
jgi:hypothetical protein